MKRSELIQIGINLSTAGMQEPNEHNFFRGNANEDMRALNALGLELFLAEQKRYTGCEQCNRVAALVVLKRQGAKFCKNCGRCLTDGESE